MGIPRFPKDNDGSLEKRLIPEVLQWSIANGLLLYPPNFEIDKPCNAPTTLFPTPFPKKSFQHALALQTIYNEVYAKVAQGASDDWLVGEIDNLAHFDPEFTGRLWGLYLKAKVQGISQKISLGVFRSDYLLDNEKLEVKQVEFNTVSVSFGGLSSKVCELHKYLNDSGKYDMSSKDSFYQQEIPVSDSDLKLAKGLAEGAKAYKTRTGKPIVAFIVQNGERNVFDQKILEYNLLRHFGVRSVRITIQGIHELTRLDPNDKRLYYVPTGEEIGVVYFRAGYSPSDYLSEQDWENRLTLEISFAIKAPNLLTQLAGTKKIQQLLTDSSVLERFTADSSSLEMLKSSFVEMYPLDDSDLGRKGKELALKQPQDFVLKPQREGGGNNIYKNDIPKFLAGIPESEWSGYILMQLIKPQPTTDNIVLRGREISREPILSELGIFGYVVFDDSNILVNETAGWLLRSKSSSSDEGGVAAGFGCVDSVVLY
ncbi:LAMI_0F06678g1_1 [Lachancea mirantina]|uniref:Glutathione synthetase n=1 Tax=Lachancea mirantina TaxID=1230905 RepID=A0A1G4JZC1_9SACH|nr:LAMI_0F06678g1_1 [Lachancea mirantina]